jgi:glycosyltransferase involved in cell wall biosynthesis
MPIYIKEKPRYFEQSIESMLAQTVKPEQIVIVKDGYLNDELDSVIKKYTTRYFGLFTIVTLETNQGIGKALDIGLKSCRNELVARMDTDDISLPVRCEKQLKMFEKYPELGLLGSNVDEFYDESENVKSTRRVPSDYESIVKFMRRRSPFNHPTVMFRKSEVVRCGGYGQMRKRQDLDLFARMLNMGCFALNVDESLLLFRSNEDNFKRRKSWENCMSYIEVIKGNWRRGYCSFTDYLYVAVTQTLIWIMPVGLFKWISNKFLREKYERCVCHKNSIG